MEKPNIYNLIVIEEYASTPKYLQIINSITHALENGAIKKSDPLPSINELSFAFDISRDTVEKGYKYLKDRKIIVSFPGKGYYVNDIDVKRKFKIFLLFNKLSVHKKMIYDSLIANLEEDAAVDLFVYNNDFALFKKFILNKRTDYSHYVVIPHFLEEDSNIESVIKHIPKEKLIFLDKKLPFLKNVYSAVFENFEKDIYSALTELLGMLSKYHTLKIIFPKQSYFPKEIIKGFESFCIQYAFNYAVVEDVSKDVISEKQVYISLMEDDLVVLVEKILAQNLEVGKGVGVISYNETPLKKYILNGITTISSDFNLMGAMLAQTIKGSKKQQIEVPFKVNLRPSL